VNHLSLMFRRGHRWSGWWSKVFLWKQTYTFFAFFGLLQASKTMNATRWEDAVHTVGKMGTTLWVIAWCCEVASICTHSWEYAWGSPVGRSLSQLILLLLEIQQQCIGCLHLIWVGACNVYGIPRKTRRSWKA
jgi:hypothetical protein